MMEIPKDEDVVGFVQAAMSRIGYQLKFDLSQEIYYDELVDFLTDLVKSGEVRSVQVLAYRAHTFILSRIKKLSNTNDELDQGYHPITRFTAVEYDRYLCELDESEKIILNTLIHVDYSELRGLVQLLKSRDADYITPLLKTAIDIRMSKMADSIDADSGEDTITRKLLILGRLESYDANLAKLYAIGGPEWMYYFTLVMGGETIKIPTQKEFSEMLGEVDEFRKSPEVVFRYGKWKSLVKLSDQTSFSGMLLTEYIEHTMGLITKVAQSSGAYNKLHLFFKELTGTFLKLTQSIKALSEFENKLRGITPNDARNKDPRTDAGNDAATGDQRPGDGRQPA